MTVVQPRAVFRIEPAKPDFQRALQDINYGTAMDEEDIAVIRGSLQNILDFFIPALKETSRDGSAFLSCFKINASWQIILVILKRCEAVVKYCLKHDGMQHVQQSLGTLRIVKGKQPRRSKKSCGVLAAQAKKTIWLYEAWWKAPSLRSPKGVKPEKGHNGRAFDALTDAFMQTQEGVLLHELVHLASIGQMTRLIPSVYPRGDVPSSLWQGQDLVGDAVVHDYVNTALHHDGILDAKYACSRKGGNIERQAAYHLAGVRDLASLEKGAVASVLNADSYNAFAALALMDRVQTNFANRQLDLARNIIPNLSPDAANRLQKAIAESRNLVSIMSGGNDDATCDGKKALSKSPTKSIAGWHQNGRLSDLGGWPTLADAAAAKVK